MWDDRSRSYGNNELDVPFENKKIKNKLLVHTERDKGIHLDESSVYEHTNCSLIRKDTYRMEKISTGTINKRESV